MWYQNFSFHGHFRVKALISNVSMIDNWHGFRSVNVMVKLASKNKLKIQYDEYKWDVCGGFIEHFCYVYP